MYEVFTEMHFSASHHLRDYQGDCAKVHGHNWLVRATAQAPSLNNLGIAVDFKALKRHLHTVIDPMDHEDLNTLFTPELGNPTAENIARFIFEGLSPLVAEEEGSAVVTRIDIWETPGNCASYYNA